MEVRSRPAISNSAPRTGAERGAKPREVVPRAQTRSLERGLAALEFVATAGEASVSETAAALGLPRPSAHILLTTLTAAGYLRQARRRGRYRMDLRVLKVARELLVRLPVRERAAPLLYELAQATGLSAYLAVLSHGEIVTVDRVVPRPRRQASVDVGTANPAYASSMGKALLAHLPPEELEAYLAEVHLEPITERTITSVPAFRNELTRVREQGYALSEGEHLPGVRSVAAPVFNVAEEAVAAVCVRHYTPAGHPVPESLIETVVEVAERMSHTLGYGAAVS